MSTAVPMTMMPGSGPSATASTVARTESLRASGPTSKPRATKLLRIIALRKTFKKALAEAVARVEKRNRRRLEDVAQILGVERP